MLTGTSGDAKRFDRRDRETRWEYAALSPAIAHAEREAKPDASGKGADESIHHHDVPERPHEYERIRHRRTARPRSTELARGASTSPTNSGWTCRCRCRARRRGRRAGRCTCRDRPDGAGPVDARREPDDAASAHAAHRPRAVGPGHDDRRRHDQREGGDRLRPVPGCDPGAGTARGHRAHRRAVVGSRADRPRRDRRRRRRADAADLRVDRIARRPW